LSDDLHAIVRLTYDYALYNDTFELDPLLGCFAEESSFDMRPVGLGLYEGKAAIRDFFEREKRALSHVMHHTSNHRIDVDGDEGSGTVYHIAIAVIRRTGEENHARGYYDDRYVRTAAGWRFRSRTAMPLIPWTPVRAPAGP
jgi:hypothetical protein